MLIATITIAIAVIAIRAHRNAVTRGRVQRNLAICHATDRACARQV